MNVRLIQKTIKPGGSAGHRSIPVLTLLVLMGACCVFAQQPAASAGSASAPKLNPLIRDQRLFYQEREKQIDDLVSQGTQLELKQNFDMAVDKYLEAKKIADDILKEHAVPSFKTRSDNCALKISNAYFYWAKSIYNEAVRSAKDKDFQRAIDKCRQAIEIYPPCKEKMEKIIEQYTRMKDEANVKQKLKTLDPSPEEVREKQILLRQGQVFYETKQWDKARAKFEEVIVIDPYNETAIDYIRRINLQLSAAARYRTENIRTGRNAAAAWEMVTPLISQESSEQSSSESPVSKVANNDKILNKLKDIIIDKIVFEEVSIPTAIRYLKQCSKEKDPEKVGVNFVLRGKINSVQGAEAPAAENNNANQNQNNKEPENTEVAPLTMMLDKIPLETVIRYICMQANLKYRVDDNAVVIASKDVPLDDVITKVYPVDKSAISLRDGQTIQEFLTEAGVTFDAGASAVYKDYIGRLIMTNTPKEHKVLEDFLSKQNKIDPQVLIQTKFVEVKLNDLEELGFKYTFSRLNSNVQYKRLDDSNLTALAPTESADFTKITNIYTVDRSNNAWGQYSSTHDAGKYTNDTLSTVYYTDAPLQKSSQSYVLGTNEMLRTYSSARTLENTTDDGKAAEFSIWNKNGYKLNTQIYALDQADSADVLSCPRVTTMHDTTATIQLVTEKYFPKDWDEAEYTIMGNNVPVFTGSKPDLGDETQLGISLEVRPFVEQPENEVIHLIMRPLLRKFIGWDDYSYTVPMRLNDNAEPVNVPNTMIMPRIEQRTVDASVTCNDKGTIVLGGLIGDEVSMVEDKYPVLGDLPLIGRFFQSKGRSSQKYNLLIFLSCRLVNPDGSPLREREDAGLPPFKY